MIAVCAAKFVGYVCKKMGRQGVTWAGKVAIKICPDILEQLSSQVRKAIFATCGTNGKTTTNNMLCAALEAEGQKVICNHTGSNMLNGVVAAFVLASKWNGKIDADYACIEADEASTRHIFPRIKPDYMLLTNLFRDQLDRYGEIDITMNILEEMMRKVPKMQIIVNGDDALSAYLAMDSGNPYVTYGISKPVIKSAANEIREGRFCKRCGEKLEYRFYHYSQLGDYYCPKCGFARPKPDFDAEDVKVGDQLSFCVEGKHIVANYKGFYNVYNILAAYAGVRTAGFAGEHFGDMLRRFNPENGRMEQFRIKGTGVTLNLAKNPAGFNQNISAVMQDQAPKDIIIAINDNAQDGTDISWLWDVDFDLLGNDKPQDRDPCKYPHHRKSERNRNTQGKSHSHGLRGDRSVRNLLNLFIENVHGRLCLYDEVSHDHCDGNKKQRVGRLRKHLSEIISRRHEAHVHSRKEKHQPSICIDETDRDLL